jgi:hypothetical protein
MASGFFSRQKEDAGCPACTNTFVLPSKGLETGEDATHRLGADAQLACRIRLQLIHGNHD